MLPVEDMRRSSVKEYTDTTNRRCTGESKTVKGTLLDEFVEVSDPAALLKQFE